MKVLHCPNCNRKYNVYEIAKTDFLCYGCQTPIQYNLTSGIPVRGTQTVYTNFESQQNNHKQDEQVSKRVNWHGIWFNVAIIVGFVILFGILVLIMGSIRGYIDRPPSTQTTSPVNSSATNSYPSTPSTNEQQANTQPIQSSNSQYQLCSVRFINTLRGTDKTGGYKATTDVKSKTLTLTLVGNSNEIITIHFEGGGLHTFKLYEKGSLEATKTMYRRTDLESNNKEIIYTSRTEQVKIIIKYD